MPPSALMVRWAHARLEGSGAGTYAEVWRAHLAKLADDDEITETDIVTEENGSDVKRFEKVWDAILHEAFDAMSIADRPSRIGFARALALSTSTLSPLLSLQVPSAPWDTCRGRPESSSAGKNCTVIFSRVLLESKFVEFIVCVVRLGAVFEE